MNTSEKAILRTHRLPVAEHIADLLRRSLTEVVGETAVSGPYPFRVSPSTLHQLAAVLCVCAFHRVSTDIEGCAVDASMGCDVLLSLANLRVESKACPD